MKTVSIIRDRGQLTIPDSVRRVVPWVMPLSAVSISVVNPDQIVIEPHKKIYNWEEIWESVKKARAIKGKGKIMSAAEFLEQDRKSH